MKRNSQNLKRYKKVCAEIVEECDHRCQVCGAYIYEPTYTNFSHTESRNGKGDDWVCDKNNINFVCEVHHIEHHTRGTPIIIKNKTTISE